MLLEFCQSHHRRSGWPSSCDGGRLALSRRNCALSRPRSRRVSPGRYLLPIHAASGGIGQILVQLAANRGATVFATASSEAKLKIARARGAAVALLYDNGRFADVIRDETGGRGVDVAFDPLGAATLRATACAQHVDRAWSSTMARWLVLGEGSRSHRTRGSRLPIPHSPPACWTSALLTVTASRSGGGHLLRAP